jgi:hypothetical protein
VQSLYLIILEEQASPLALGESSPSPFYMFPQINKKQITKERMMKVQGE